MRIQRKNKFVCLKRRFIVAEPDAEDSGYSWTLAAVLGEIVLFTEDRFGPRDLTYTLLGIDFSKDGPQIWYPGSCRHIIVQLSLDCLNDRKEAYRQLAHEGVHLLSPTGRRDANVLEEGLAVFFEQWYMNHHFGDEWSPPGLPRAYRMALEGVQSLFCIDSDFVRKLRRDQPVLSKIRAEDIVRACRSVPRGLADELASPFRR